MQVNSHATRQSFCQQKEQATTYATKVKQTNITSSYASYAKRTKRRAPLATNIVQTHSRATAPQSKHEYQCKPNKRPLECRTNQPCSHNGPLCFCLACFSKSKKEKKGKEWLQAMHPLNPQLQAKYVLDKQNPILQHQICASVVIMRSRISAPHSHP